MPGEPEGRPAERGSWGDDRDEPPPDAAGELVWPRPELIQQYVDILLSRGIDWGLLGPREAGRIWDRHILNSVALSGLIPSGAGVLDVGSGAGLPGVPLAVLRPDLRVTLLEPLLRRFEFLRLAVTELGLGDRVTVVRGRAESHGARYEIVTCRAVAPLPRLLGWCMPRVARGGALLALKGASANDEVESATEALRGVRARARVHEVPVAGANEVTWVVEVRRR